MRVILALEDTDLVSLPWIRRQRRTPPALSPPHLRDAVRAVAISEWQERARAEYIGVMIVRRFHGLLVDLNAPMDLQELALAMMVQEQQHASLCMAAARSLGGESELSFPLKELQQARTEEPIEQQLLKMLATTYMVGEVTAFKLLEHTIKSVPQSGYREILREILRDEVTHSRVGQAVLGWLRRHPANSWARYPGDEQVTRWVHEAVADMRQRAVVEEQTALMCADPEAAAELSSVGVCPSDGFRGAYLNALREDVPAALAEVMASQAP